MGSYACTVRAGRSLGCKAGESASNKHLVMVSLHIIPPIVQNPLPSNSSPKFTGVCCVWLEGFPIVFGVGALFTEFKRTPTGRPIHFRAKKTVFAIVCLPTSAPHAEWRGELRGESK